MGSPSHPLSQLPAVTVISSVITIHHHQLSLSSHLSSPPPAVTVISSVITTTSCHCHLICHHHHQLSPSSHLSSPPPVATVISVTQPTTSVRLSSGSLRLTPTRLCRWTAHLALSASEGLHSVGNGCDDRLRPVRAVRPSPTSRPCSVVTT